MQTELKREGDKVWIAGVVGWSPAEKESSVHAAQETIMRFAGYDVGYDTLLGVSGLAFRMQVHKQGLCPSSPHPFCGFQCVARSTRSLPLTVRIFEVKPSRRGEVAEARKTVVESIERGMSACANGMH